MKKVLAVLFIAVAGYFGAPPPMWAGEWTLINGATANAVSVPLVVQVGGDKFCELKIDSAGTSEGIVSVYSSISLNADGTQKDRALWYSVTNPDKGDPDNHLGGPCPNFVGAELTNYNSGTFYVKLRSLK